MKKTISFGGVAPDQLVLDGHTAALFHHNSRTGAMERLFYLKNKQGDREVFGGRIVRQRNGQLVFVLQRCNPDGTPFCPGPGPGLASPCFLVDEGVEPGQLSCPEPLSPHFIHSLWKQALAYDECRDATLPTIPLDQGWYEFPWRCHLEESLGVVCRVRDEMLPRSFGYQFLDTSSPVPTMLCEGMADRDEFFGESIARSSDAPPLREMDERAFHALWSQEFKNKQSQAYQLLRFYRQSEEQRCQEVLDCTSAERERAQTMFTAALACSLVQGQHLCKAKELASIHSPAQIRQGRWHPWTEDEVLIEIAGSGTPHWLSVPLPPSLVEARAKILADVQSQLPAYFGVSKDTPGLPARRVGKEWASQFAIPLPPFRRSAHEFAIDMQTWPAVALRFLDL